MPQLDRALAGMLAVSAEFERDILWDRATAGIDQARKDGLSKREIAKRLGVSRTSVIRLLRPKKRP